VRSRWNADGYALCRRLELLRYGVIWENGELLAAASAANWICRDRDVAEMIPYRRADISEVPFIRHGRFMAPLQQGMFSEEPIVEVARQAERRNPSFQSKTFSHRRRWCKATRYGAGTRRERENEKETFHDLSFLDGNVVQGNATFAEERVI
jgi:hypothetical protein